MTLKPKNQRIAIIAAIIAIALIGYFYNRSVVERREARANAFRDIPISRGDVSITIRATGTVAPENRLEIKAPIAGRVESVKVHEGERVRRNQILAWMSSSERAAVLDAARAKGEDEVKRWEDLYRATPILSPISGTVILRNVEPGQSFTDNDAILVLSNRLTVKAQVDETDLAQVKVGLKASVILDAYPQDPVPATVAHVAFEATTVSNVTMYVVFVTPDVTPDVMRSGMTATVRFDVASKKDVVIVPNDAVKTSPEGETSVLLLKDGTRERTVVKLGLTDGKVSEVLTGLKEGDVVSARSLTADSQAAKGTNPFMPTTSKGGPRAPRSGGSSGK